ncbi:MAG: ribonuclease III [Actinomycetaceae bacterium]|nr:ribonuclease III [Arcanobacterium sp.]MDD7505350.1 ribonuclease III [Actinomycetaceae bacterium]MDY6143131.1 ribonuclease III [Arcanobacterium sp.]
MNDSNLDALLAKWGTDIDRDLLTLALTHRSYAYEHDLQPNERLEFFGDSILGYVAADYIFHTYDHDDEGMMSKTKSAAVSEKALADVARSLNLGDYIRLGIGEERSGGRNKDSILSDTVEALIAATYETHGIDVTRRVVEQHIIPQIKKASHLGPALDWRTALEERARELGIPGEITYDISGEGPDHARIYHSKVYIGEAYLGHGDGTSQKAAKLDACKDAYLKLENQAPLSDAAIR